LPQIKDRTLAINKEIRETMERIQFNICQTVKILSEENIFINIIYMQCFEILIRADFCPFYIVAGRLLWNYGTCTLVFITFKSIVRRFIAIYKLLKISLYIDII